MATAFQPQSKWGGCCFVCSRLCSFHRHAEQLCRPPHSSVRKHTPWHRYRQTELDSLNDSAAAAAEEAAGAAGEAGAAGKAAGGGAADAAGAASKAGAAAGAAAALEDECHAERDAEYGGETVVTWGDKNFLDSAAECCAACRAAAPKCNVWVWCGKWSGALWAGFGCWAGVGFTAG